MKTVFSPSPIGPPSLGLVRTALFNWALARHCGGSFVVRMEDTNGALIKAEAYQQILELLRWLGLDWDEGPDVGGPHGPYLQSERRDVYEEIVARLVAAGEVYESFFTPDDVKQRASGPDRTLKYDNADRYLTDAQKSRFRSLGQKPSLRLRLPTGHIVVNDFIRRSGVKFSFGDFVDPVLVRSNGSPTYAIAGPVDDALMGITHKFIGEDLLPFAPRRLAVVAALTRVGVAAEMPHIAHLALVHGEDGALLSASNVPYANMLHVRDDGWAPDAVVNYMASIGWAMPDGASYFTPSEFVRAFSSERVRVSPARFDIKRMTAVNVWHLRRMTDPAYLEALLSYLRGYLVGESETLATAHAAVARLAPVLQSTTKTLREAADAAAFLLESDHPAASVAQLEPTTRATLPALETALRATKSWEPGEIRDAVKTVSWSTGADYKNLLAALSETVIGRRSSSILFDSIAALGRSATLRRLRSAVDESNEATS